MKTFDKKDVYSWSNAEEAKTYIGKTGYFNNDFESIKRAIELGDPAVLDRVDTNSIWCFKALGVSLCFGLFIPAEKVKVEEIEEIEEPKKYRPFKSIKEFVEVTGLDVGQTVFLRQIKGVFAGQWTAKYLITAITNYVDDTPSITFGNDLWTVEELAEKYEYSKDYIKWLPFGVEE